jgi:hypothetical protein
LSSPALDLDDLMTLQDLRRCAGQMLVEVVEELPRSP